MTDKFEKKLTELEENSNCTPAEEVLKNALLDLDEKTEALETAKKASPADAAAIQTAQTAVTTATEAVVEAEKKA